MRQYFIWSLIIWLITIGLVLAEIFNWFPLQLTTFVVLIMTTGIMVWKFPRQSFWLFLATLPLENINLAPVQFSIIIRPFQLVGGILLLVLMMTLVIRNDKIDFKLLKIKFKNNKAKSTKNYFNPLDRLVFTLGLVALLNRLMVTTAYNTSIKLILVLFSFLGLYWLTRNFLKSYKHIWESIWFFMLGLDSVLLFGLYQIVANKFHWSAKQIMIGRINATFTEPDWLGMYLVFIIALLLGIKYVFDSVNRNQNGKLLQRIADIRIFHWSAFQIIQNIIYFCLLIVGILLLSTVSRSAWLGTIFVLLLYQFIIWLKRGFKFFLTDGLKFIILLFLIIGILKLFNLSDFHLGNRVTSSFSGLQKITVSCNPTENNLKNGAHIDNLNQLQQFNCRHINLEEIDKEKQYGRLILEIYRPDPNVEIRKNIYQITWQNIKKHFIFGSGLGSSGFILGKDSLGHSLNTSNIFLEVFLSFGLIGLIPFILIFLTPLILGLKSLQIKAGQYALKKNEFKAVFFLLTFLAILIPNLFNAGLFLGIFWIWLAVIISSLEMSN